MQTVDAKSLEQQGGSCINPGDQIVSHQWVASDLRNKAYDRISEKEPEGRADANDAVSDIVFTRLLNELQSEPIKRVKRFVNKFLAHADDSVDPQDPDVLPTWKDIDNALATLIKVHRFLVSQVLYEAFINVVPVPQYDQFADITRPFVSEADHLSAYDLWHQHRKEIDDITAGSEAWSGYVLRTTSVT